ncbi:MAG: DsrE family protein [Oceanidesulfovibrio sp.]
MGKYQFVITSGPENPVRATRAVMFASKAVDEGHDVVLFLVDDAVYLANLELAGNVAAPTGDDLMRYMRVILDNDVPVNVCLPCAKARRIQADSLPAGWRIEKGVEAIRSQEQGYATWVF